MTKMQLFKRLKEVDDRILLFFNKKPKIDPRKLKKAELERLLDAFETMDELFRKCSIKEEE